MNMTYEVYIDLKSNGLTHVKGKSDHCEGWHTVKVSEEETQYLIQQLEPSPGATAAAQKLHELAHPDGSVYIENCTEQVCADLLAEL